MPEIVVPVTVRDLAVEDLPSLGESPSKLTSMVQELARAQQGEVDYLAVCTPSGQPVGYGAVDYTKPPGGATLYQLTVLTPFQSCGIGTILIHALEDHIRARGIPFAELGIDDASPRPQALYERLGYVVSGSELGSWDIDTPDGTARYETTITLLRKQLLQTAPKSLASTVYLIVGLPGAGKTTRAKELEVAAPALRLTPDEWQIALFDYENPDDKRDLVEGKLIEIGMRAAQLGADVVFDFGFWSRDERSALRSIAASLGVGSRVVYLPIDPEEQRQRITHRFATTPDQTFAISEAELAEWRTVFEPPDQAELEDAALPLAPPDHSTWSAWASHRWPSLPELVKNPVE